MKILLTATTYPRHKEDTIPSFVHDFARQLANRSWVEEVHVLAPHTAGAAAEEVMDGVQVHRYRYWPNARGEDITYGGAVQKKKRTPIYVLKLISLLIRQTFATYRIVSRYNINVVNAHWIIPMGFIACLLRIFTKIPVIITVHGGDVFSLRGSVMTRVKAWTLKYADKVVVNSSATKIEAEKLYKGKNYPIIPMGVDVTNLRPKRKVPRKRGQPLRLLFVGRLSEEKGIEYLIDAVHQIEREGRNVMLTIAGSGSREASLKAQAARLGLGDTIKFVGWVPHDDFPVLFANADVFVGLSIIADSGWQEAFGLVFAESLALNTPVVGTATGGIRDIVKNGVNGLLVPPRDAPALAAAIEQFIDLPILVDDLSKDVRADIEKRFSWKPVIDKYEVIFQELAS